MTPSYESTGSLLIVAAPRQSVNGFSLSPSQAIATQAALITQRPLLSKVISDLYLSMSPEQLSAHTKVTPQADTELLTVTVTDRQPKLATDLVNTLMADFVADVSRAYRDRDAQSLAALGSQISTLQDTLGTEQADLVTQRAEHRDTAALDAQIQTNQSLLRQLTVEYGTLRSQLTQDLDSVRIASPGILPAAPSSPKVLTNTAVGALAGLLIGGGLATLLQFLDQGLLTEEDVRQKLGLTALAVIPRYDTGRRGGAAAAERRAEAAGEAYRRLRTNVLFSAIDRQLSSIVVTSAQPSETKTRTAANLAAVVAGAGEKVLLVDADLRHPSQHRIFDHPITPGKSEMLLLASRVKTPQLYELPTTVPNLGLLPAGTVPPNPAELLSSRHLRDLVDRMTHEHDLVIIDTAPMGVVTDGLSLASRAAGSIIVIEAGRTNARQVRATVDALNRVGANVLGVVLNKVRDRHAHLQTYYGDYRRGGVRPIGDISPAGTARSPGAAFDSVASFTPLVGSAAAAGEQ